MSLKLNMKDQAKFNEKNAPFVSNKNKNPPKSKKWGYARDFVITFICIWVIYFIAQFIWHLAR